MYYTRKKIFPGRPGGLYLPHSVDRKQTFYLVLPEASEKKWEPFALYLPCDHITNRDLHIPFSGCCIKGETPFITLIIMYNITLIIQITIFRCEAILVV